LVFACAGNDFILGKKMKGFIGKNDSLVWIEGFDSGYEIIDGIIHQWDEENNQWFPCDFRLVQDNLDYGNGECMGVAVPLPAMLEGAANEQALDSAVTR
jgi:hypothetical protein